MATRIGVMAGGTGGHVFPALAVAEALRAQGADVFWIGTRRGMESHLVPEQGFDMEWVEIAGLRGKGLGAVLSGPFKLLGALRQAWSILRRRRPAVILGMGGFVSGPGGLAARALGIPLVIHEQNAIPGLTNQWLARIASRVFEAFPGSFPQTRNAIATGNPVRPAIAALPPPRERFAGRTGPAHLLVVGGSLGAQALNETLPPALARLPAASRPLVRHQAGERTLAAAQTAYLQTGVAAEVTAFIGDMAQAYAWADLVVCRAGALTVSELATAGLGAILVPYPHAVDDHQVSNAHYLTEVGAAILIIQRDLDPAGLALTLETLLADRSRLLTMAAAARTRATPAAVEQIAAACLEFARS